MLFFYIRCERLEDQLNDLTELHQNETANLKQELASIEEKMAYQAYERARDIQVCTVTHMQQHSNTMDMRTNHPKLMYSTQKEYQHIFILCPNQLQRDKQ